MVPDPPPPAKENAPPLWLLGAILGVAAAVFIPALGAGFLGDDFVYIARFSEMPWAAWPQFFTHEWSGGVWGQPLKELRPFAALSFMIDARLWGGHALGYRLVNLALHLTATGLLVRLAWHYAGPRVGARRVAWVAGLVFAVHPVHVETVVWITGRPDLLGSVAALAFVWAAEVFSTRGGIPTAVSALTALFFGVFTKEFCLTVPVLLLLRWLLLDPSAGRTVWGRRGGLMLGALAVIVGYAVARYAAFGADTGNGFFGWNDSPAWNRQATYWGWILPVLPFTTGHEWATPPALGMLRVAWLGLAALTGLALIIGLVRRTAWLGAVFFGGFWWFATTFGLFVVVYFSPRHLYLPSAGVAVGVGLALGAGRWRRSLAVVVIGWCLAAHFAALAPWREAGRLSREVLAAFTQDIAAGDEKTIALVAVPETRGHVLLWAWSCPQALGAPFLPQPRLASQVIERPVNFVRSDRWVAEHQPVETVRAASSAAVVFVEADGHVVHRLVPGAELGRRGDELAVLVAQGLNPDNLTAWIKSCAQP